METSLSVNGRHGRRAKQIQFLGVVPQLYPPLEAQSDLLEHGNGTPIVEGGDGDDALDTQHIATVGEHRRGRFRGITLGPMLLEKRETDIGIDERVALHQATHAYGSPVVAQRDVVQTETVSTIALKRPLRQIF